MRQRHRRQRPNDLISAEELACWTYCPEQWRLQNGQGLPAENQAALDAGTRHHERKAVAERVAGGSIALGRFLIVLAIVLPLLWLWWRS